MKILLVYANTYKMLSPPPVGLSMVARSASEAGHDVVLLDMMHTEDADRALAQALARTKPDLVGFSLRNLDNQALSNSQSFVPDYCRWVSTANEVAPTVVGGSALMCIPEELFLRVGATYGLCGQGDKVFPQLVQEIEKGKLPFETPGALWREDGRVKRSVHEGLLDGYLDGGRIDWSVIDIERYRKSEMPAAVITKTGCKNRCIFCDASRAFGPDYVPREPEQVVEDLRRDAREYRNNRFLYFFIDPMFNEPVDWTKSVCEEIIRSEIKIGYSALVEPIASDDQELIRLLKRSGCLMVTSLLGSIDDSMLEQMRVPSTATDIARTYQLLEDAGIPYMPQLLLGGPGETEKTVEACLRFVEHLKPIMIDIAYGIRINPGAGIYQIALNEGVVTEQTDMLVPRFYLSSQLDRVWLENRIKRFKRWRVPPLWQWTRMIMKTLALRRGG